MNNDSGAKYSFGMWELAGVFHDDWMRLMHSNMSFLSFRIRVSRQFAPHRIMFCILFICYHSLSCSNNMLYPKEDKRRRVLTYSVCFDGDQPDLTCENLIHRYFKALGKRGFVFMNLMSIVAYLAWHACSSFHWVSNPISEYVLDQASPSPTCFILKMCASVYLCA